MRLWVQDSVFGPKAHATTNYKMFINLISSCILVCNGLEARVKYLGFIERENEVFFAFNSRPDFRRTMRNLAKEIGKTLISFAKLLGSNRSGNNDLLSSARAQMDSLKRAESEFNSEYYIAREKIYYSCHGKNCCCSLQPVIPSVFLEMNSFLFLLDSTCRHLSTFWQEKSESSEHFQSIDLLTMLQDIVPSQSHLFPKWSGISNLPLVVKRRLKQSLTVSIAILFAGLYGLYSEYTNQTSLAAFTIAYITGAVVFGANMLTSLSRSIGTVAASVYSMIIVRMIANCSVTDRYLS